jgi:ribosome-binding factor A
MEEKESTRQRKVAREIEKVLAEAIRAKGMAFFSGALVSVSGVKISPDLSVARAYLSVFPSEKTDAVMATIEENAKAFRGELGSKMGKQLRIIPEISFFVDNSLDYVAHIDQLLKK